MASFSNAGTQRGNEGQGHKPENAGGKLPPAFSWPVVREQLERGAFAPTLLLVSPPSNRGVQIPLRYICNI